MAWEQTRGDLTMVFLKGGGGGGGTGTWACKDMHVKMLHTELTCREWPELTSGPTCRGGHTLYKEMFLLPGQICAHLMAPEHQ